MQYYTFLEGNKTIVNDYTDDIYCAVFPATDIGIKSLRIYSNYFTTYKELVESRKFNLYTFTGPRPTRLPFNMNLNYTDIRSAKN